MSPLGEKGDGKNGHGENRSYLILFEDVTSGRTAGADDAPQGKAKSGVGSKGDTRRLMVELAATQDTLRSDMELEDSLKEEFQSANEEILSANEELQSSNEELETSKEELQSANEELNTLNAELRFKNMELHDLSNDISNLLNSTRIPVVMLDRRLRIRRLTPTAGKLLKVVPSDVGRSVADIRLNIEPKDLESGRLEPMIAKVLESLQPMERDVRETYRELLNALPVAVYTTDADGTITFFNEAAANFADRRAQVGKDQWCVTHRLYYPDGRALPHDEWDRAWPMGCAKHPKSAWRVDPHAKQRARGQVWPVLFDVSPHPIAR